jgi:hypothetical protein
MRATFHRTAVDLFFKRAPYPSDWRIPTSSLYLRFPRRSGAPARSFGELLITSCFICNFSPPSSENHFEEMHI